MGELQDLLIRLRGSRSYREIAQKANISHGYLRTLEQGKHPVTGAAVMPSADILKALAQAYGYPYEKLLHAAGYLDDDSVAINNENVMRVPVYSDIRDGKGIIIDYRYFPKRYLRDASYICVSVNDNSMFGAKIGINDVVLVRKQTAIEDQQVMVVEINGSGALIRRVRLNGDMVILEAESIAYDDVEYPASQIKVLGVVVLILAFPT